MAESGVEFIADILIKYHRAMNTIFLCDGARLRSQHKRNQPYFEFGQERDHRETRHFEIGQERDHRKS